MEVTIRERAAIRCAKATMLLYSLASSRDLTATVDSAGEVRDPSLVLCWKQKEEETRREIEDLKRKLAMEKKMRDRIKLCGLMELLLLVVLVLLLSTFFLVFFLRSP